MLTQGHLMKIKWLVANVTAVGSPDRVYRANFGGRGPIQAVFVAGEPLCDVETPS